MKSRKSFLYLQIIFPAVYSAFFVWWPTAAAGGWYGRFCLCRIGIKTMQMKWMKV